MTFPPKQKKKILIVDDHAVVRDGLTFQLSSQPDLEVCGEAESEDEALQLAKDTKPDLAIVDISLKAGDGIELLKRIRSSDTQVKLLVLTMYKESLYAEPRCERVPVAT